ncbi:lecithin retinol acyltransferase family protein [Reinekea blandensis]|nr:lecithin retinol acyltransferase family protein [Reinekea blandensis]
MSTPSMASHKLSADERPMPGDHLWVRKQGYTHHGLYLGENDAGEPLVAHYAGWIDGLRGGPLELTDLDNFRSERTVHVRHYRHRVFSREDSVLRVLSRLGEDDYDVHTNNCEHLCHWAIMGDQRSQQVEWVDTVLGAIHPGLEAASRSLSAARQPGHLRAQRRRKALNNIARDLAIDWGVKSAARWVAGPVGMVAYVGYRVSRQWLKSKR